MPEPSPSSSENSAPASSASTEAFEDSASWIQKLTRIFKRPKPTKAQLIAQLHMAKRDELIDADSTAMLEGVIHMAELTAGDALVAAPRMDAIDINAPIEEIIHVVIDTAHSRFPVYEGDKENIIGILLAKDLLKFHRSPDLHIRALLRPAVFIPESKGLNDLLRQFKDNRNHLAIVVDEFGRTAGLITIEDVLEQIVGEIEDEFDEEEGVGDVFALADDSFRVNGATEPARLEEAFGVTLQASDNEEFETVGGLVAHELGRVPKSGEQFEFAQLHFTVLHTKGGAVRWFKVKPLEQAAQTEASTVEPSLLKLK